MFPVSRGGKSTDILYLEVQEEVQILVLKTTPVNVQVLIQFLYSKVKNVQALKCNQSKKVKSCSLGDISIFVQS